MRGINTLWFHLYVESIKKVRFIEPEGRSVVAWSRGLGAMGRCWPRHKRSGRRLTFCCSVTQSCPTFWSHGLQHARLPCHLPSPEACSNSCPLGWWCHPTISSSVVPFFSCLQFFPASGSFLMSQLFSSGGQSIGAAASASVLPMNIQGISDFTKHRITWEHC